MSQVTLDDDDLFEEASDELKRDVEEAIQDARDALPDGDALLEVDADNLVGALNAFKADLDTDAARDALREAKKWFETGRRADGFDDDFAEEAGADIDDLVAIVDAAEDAEAAATDLTDAVAQLKKRL